MVVRLPLAARSVPPLTGASSHLRPCSAARGQRANALGRHRRHRHDHAPGSQRPRQSRLTKDGLLGLVRVQHDHHADLGAAARFERGRASHSARLAVKLHPPRHDVIAAHHETLAQQAVCHRQAHRPETDERHRFRHAKLLSLASVRASLSAISQSRYVVVAWLRARVHRRRHA